MFLAASSLGPMTDISQQLANQRQLAIQQLDQRCGMSDELDVPRAVDHSGLFPDNESAVKASHELAALGYTTDIEDDEDYVLLEAQKVTAVDAETVEKFIEEVLTVFHRYGGEYDGWGAPIVSSALAAAAPRRSWIQRLFRSRS